MSMGGTLHAVGEAARAIETVTWVMFAGGAVIFLCVMLLLIWALRARSKGAGARWWIWGAASVTRSARDGREAGNPHLNA